jgi:hypothetical protein
MSIVLGAAFIGVLLYRLRFAREHRRVYRVARLLDMTTRDRPNPHAADGTIQDLRVTLLLDEESEPERLVVAVSKPGAPTSDVSFGSPPDGWDDSKTHDPEFDARFDVRGPKGPG